MVVDYNKAKDFVDISYLRGSYHSPLRRSLKWYRKVAFEILLNTSLLNALTLFTTVIGNKMGVTEFRENMIQALLTKANISKTLKTIGGEIHKLVNSKRGRCSNCYFEMVQQEEKKHAQAIIRKVNTLCPGCYKHFCLHCFFKMHLTKKPNLKIVLFFCKLYLIYL